MRAVAVLPSKREVGLVEHPEPTIRGPREVKAKSLEVGICGTDREICSFVYGSPPAGFDYLILGHEALGRVEEIGGAVSGIRPGDLVVPSVRRPCSDERCASCRGGLQDFCFTGKFTERGIRMNHGFMTERFVEDERFLTVLPVGLREVGVLIEPLTVAEKAIAQIHIVQRRLPWADVGGADTEFGAGRRAVVLGAGPVGVLGAMALRLRGFDTYVYSRSAAPNPRSKLVEAFGAEYISSTTVSPAELSERVGPIDVVYEAAGVAGVSFDVLRVLGVNGIFVFTGIPFPNSPIEVDADLIMRNLVLKNQVVLGTVNADPASFQHAVRDLEAFQRLWPTPLQSIITGRHGIDSARDLLLGERSGIKNVVSLD